MILFTSVKRIARNGILRSKLIEAIVDSNTTRKDFVANQVLQMVWDKVYAGKQKPVVGVYNQLGCAFSFHRNWQSL
jgi:UDP-glucose 6-dehydrogenase